MNELQTRISDIGVVPVIKLADPKRDAAALAGALREGGVPVAEVTFRAAGAAEGIRIMHESFPDMLVGAGTVLTTAQADEAVAAGASFIVTPGLDREIVEHCLARNITIFPGCTTATDYHAAYKYGLEVLKFFPAEQSGGLAKIKALAAPFPMFKVMPTGGISLKNLAQYAACPVIAACGGSYMVTSDLIESGNWEEITRLCRESVDVVRQARGR